MHVQGETQAWEGSEKNLVYNPSPYPAQEKSATISKTETADAGKGKTTMPRVTIVLRFKCPVCNKNS